MGGPSAYSPAELDFHFDIGDPLPVCKYVAVDLRDGRHAVFLIHRDSREWWRLVAVFSSWERAERYAEVENNNFLVWGEEDGDQRRLPTRISEEEGTTAPEDRLPPDPPSRKLTRADVADLPPEVVRELSASSQRLLEPLSDKPCERCGAMLPQRRARNPNAKYCSPQCAQAAAQERLAARVAYADAEATPAAPAVYKEPKQAGEPCVDCGRPRSASAGQRCRECYEKGAAANPKPAAIAPPFDKRGAELSEIQRFVSERGVTKLPSAFAAESKQKN